jgi:hypothetical protein
MVMMPAIVRILEENWKPSSFLGSQLMKEGSQLHTGAGSEDTMLWLYSFQEMLGG